MQQMSRQRRDPADLSIEEACDRFLRRKRGGLAEATVKEYGYRLNRFREFCDQEGIETAGDLHPLDFDDYLAYREALGVKPVTIHSHFKTIREWVDFLDSLGAVEDDLADAVPHISLDEGAEVSETSLAVADGDALIRHYRQDEAVYGTVEHALLELIWFTGARLGAVRALDLGDVWLDENAVAFRHRPEQGTPLKNRSKSERIVAIDDATADALAAYANGDRYETRDDHGRDPFITSSFGRPSTGTIRNWTQLATQPCVRMECPHGKARPTCEWRASKQSSQCPSARSPHEVRTGAITRMLNHTTKERVSYRADTSQFEHYDVASQREKLENRDRAMADDIALDADGDSQ